MKTVIQIVESYLQARAAADTAMADPARLDYEEFLRQSGRREAYADVLELDEATFTAPPAEDEPLPRVRADKMAEGRAVMIAIPRAPDDVNHASNSYWLLSVHQARELRDALDVLDWPTLDEGQAGQ